MTHFDTREAFQHFLLEYESFGTRLDRFMDDTEAANPATLLKWLEAAFVAGGVATAKDTIDTLYLYGTHVAGIPQGPGFASEKFDTAAENLHEYYNQVFGTDYSEDYNND